MSEAQENPPEQSEELKTQDIPENKQDEDQQQQKQPPIVQTDQAANLQQTPLDDLESAQMTVSITSKSQESKQPDGGEPSHKTNISNPEELPNINRSLAQPNAGGAKPVTQQKENENLPIQRLNLQVSMIKKPNEEEEEQEGIKPPEEVQKTIAENFYYEKDHIETQLEDSPLTRKLIEFHQAFGFDSFKRYNLNLLDSEHMIYAAGVTYQIFNLVTKEVQIFFSRDGGGIGSIAVHPSKKYFAVAEKGVWPNIYVYEYPSLKLYRIMKHCTERSFTTVSFSQSGNLLAAVGWQPDYTISLWNWKQEIIILKAKAFSQEVYNVRFSMYSEHILATSGLGHIKFWKVAETFTGLKLKGEIAKFGQVELSDVVSYYIFQDGKVLSSTEQGNMLLWEGNLIKCVIVVDKETNTKCHQSYINVIFRKEGDIVSAGADGYIKFWDCLAIDNAEGDDFGNFYIKPTSELFISSEDKKPANIFHIIVSETFWLVQDLNGRILKLEIAENKIDFQVTVILNTNYGKLSGLAVSPVQNCAITAGDDGYVRVWDYVNHREFYQRQFVSQATCCEWLPYSKRNLGRIVIVGYANGIVRWLILNQQGIFLLKVYKVHTSKISFIKCTTDGSIVAIISVKGEIFFIEHSPSDLQKIEPFCLFDTKLKINDIQWSRLSDKLLLACQDGKIYEIKVPKKEECDNDQTYLKDFISRSYTIKMMEFQKPKTEEMELEFLLKRKNDDKKEDVEWEPAPIMNCTYYNNDCTQVLATVEGKYIGYLYIIDFSQPFSQPMDNRPIDAIQAPKIATQYLNLVDYGDLLLIGFVDGSWQVRHKYDLKVWLQASAHDRDSGKVRRLCLNMDQTALLSAAEDGTMYTCRIDMGSFKQSVKGDICQSFNYPELTNGISEVSFKDVLEVSEQEVEDIIDDTGYSIQQQKLEAEEDYRKREAEKKKQKVRQEIKGLVDLFEELKKRNNEIDEIARLTDKEMSVDPELIERLNKRVQDDLEETRKELQWDAEFAKLKLMKLQSYVKDELQVDTFAVKAIKNPRVSVSTFKVKKLNQYLQSSLQEIYKLIEEEKRNQEQNTTLGGGSGVGDDQKKMTNTLGAGSGATGNLAASALNPGVSVGGAQKDQQAGGAGAGDSKGQTQKLEEQKKATGMVGKDDQQQQPQVGGAKAERMKLKQEESRIRAELEELEKTKPTPELFGPDHLRDINEATEQLGDYKLKSSQTYVVPENQRMNVSKKRKHMFLLEEFIYKTKMKFNNEIISLKERKKKLIDKIQNYYKKITDINQQLGKTEELFIPQFDKALELPELQLEITEEQIDEYARQKLRESSKKAGGMGMGGGGGDEKDNKQQQSQQPQQSQAEANKQGGDNNAGKKKQESVTAGFKQRKGIKVQKSDLEDEMKQINEMVLQAEKQRMLDEINEETELFDKDVINCQNEKNILESDMTIAQMKLITFYQELLVLMEMEDQDNKLINNLLNHKKEKQDLKEQSDKVVGELNQLANKDASNEKELNEQMKAFKEFVYPDDDHKREKIHQYYLRKFKKSKAKQLKLKSAEEEGDDLDEEEESEEEDDDDFLDEDDDEKPDISPVENDTKVRDIMDRICELEDLQETNRKEKMDLERQKVQIANKIQNIVKELKKAEEELRNYQRKKLQRVNLLDVSFCLRVDQIRNLMQLNENQFKLPDDMSQSILFTNSEFQRLCRRIKELEAEQKKIDRQRKQLVKRKKVLEKQISEKTTKLEELNKKYEEKHMLKFGDHIDLKVLDALEPTKQVLEMREKFKQEEREAIKRIEKSKISLLNKKQKLLDNKRENTKIITRITQLGDNQMKLNKKLDSTNKQLFKEENEDKKNKGDLDRERQNLNDLVKFLNKEIEDLKTEIGLFKRKGGHIYTMVTSNKKTFN